MKNIFRTRRIWVLMLLILLFAAVIFWPRKQPPYTGYGIVLYEYTYKPHLLYPGDNPVLAKLKIWYYELTGGDSYRDVKLSDSEAKGLEKILSGHDFKIEGGNIRNFDKAVFDFGVPVANFMVGINGEPYLLRMCYRGAVSATEKIDSSVLTLHKVQRNRKGVWVQIDPEDGKYFTSERLYNDLEEFLRRLPSSNPCRSQYDAVHNFFTESAEER